MIDVHAHAVFEMVMGAAWVHGPELLEVDGQPRFRAGGYELCNVRYRGSVFMERELRIAAMDAAGIHLQVISPNPLTYFHFIGPDDAVNHNDQMAAVVAAHAPRLKGFATLPMQNIPAALRELRRAVSELGLVGGSPSPSGPRRVPHPWRRCRPLPLRTLQAGIGDAAVERAVAQERGRLPTVLPAPVLRRARAR